VDARETPWLPRIKSRPIASRLKNPPAPDNGKIIWDYDTTHEFKTVNGIPGRGGAIDIAGPVVAGGMLYVVSGNAARGGLPGNVLVAFSAKP
jgi:outer membrane protein assembly factor BamB